MPLNSEILLEWATKLAKIGGIIESGNNIGAALDLGVMVERIRNMSKIYADQQNKETNENN